MADNKNPMRDLKISKITVNMGVGEGGEKLAKAETLLESLTDQKPVKTMAKFTDPTFGTRKGLPIGCKVTLRRDKAEDFLKKALDAVDYTIQKSSVDRQGNVSFGIKEHIDIPGVKYDPKVGIFGMDVALTIERPGYRVKKRMISKKKVSKHHQVGRPDSIKFLQDQYKITLEEAEAGD
ncbi:MAG: 50S ribosomal protein L5 [Desulfatiglandales bacterium]